MRPLSLTLIAFATLGLSIALAHPGPYSDAIAQVEAAANQSTGNPVARPTAPQLIGAQLGRNRRRNRCSRPRKALKSRFAAV